MARQVDKLTARRVQALKEPGRHSDGGGLYLVIYKSGSKRWAFIFRRKRDGKQSELGFGGLGSVSLARARELAADARAAIADGDDPRTVRDAASRDFTVPTFGEFAQTVIASLEDGWRNAKHRAQWHSTIATYCAPIADKLLPEITTDDIVAVLRPIWTDKSETASRVRGRIEKILDAAKAKGLRSGENPARWRGHLDHLLPKRQKLQRGHHPAMPWQNLPNFIARLRERPAVAAMALEFLILTAGRSGEVLGAQWQEFDLEAQVWTVPPERMKAGREHRVPLSGRACAILHELRKVRTSAFVFPAPREGKKLSDMAMEMLLRRMQVQNVTVHGFRSTFRDWCGEATDYPREVAEAALAHTIGNAVERAYRRGDALEKRRTLMEAWSAYAGSRPDGLVADV
jgi:integrase